MARTKDPAIQRRRRAQVLQATLTLLERQSWQGTTLAAVARQAEVSKGVVTYWFPDKDALIVSAFDAYHEAWRDRLAGLVSGHDPVSLRIDALVGIALPDADTVAREVALQAEIVSYAKARPEVADRIRASYTAFRRITEALVAVGQAEGIVVDPDPELPRMVHALIDGLSLQIAADPTTDVPALREALVRHLQRWFRGPS